MKQDIDQIWNKKKENDPKCNATHECSTAGRKILSDVEKPITETATLLELTYRPLNLCRHANIGNSRAKLDFSRAMKFFTIKFLFFHHHVMYTQSSINTPPTSSQQKDCLTSPLFC